MSGFSRLARAQGVLLCGIAPLILFYTINPRLLSVNSGLQTLNSFSLVAKPSHVGEKIVRC